MAVRQLSQLLAGRLDESPIPAGLQSERPFDVAWPTLVGRSRDVHAQVLEELDWKAHSIIIHMHNREHIGQVQRVLASIGR